VADHLQKGKTSKESKELVTLEKHGYAIHLRHRGCRIAVIGRHRTDKPSMARGENQELLAPHDMA
jgi:hypothetical protein